MTTVWATVNGQVNGDQAALFALPDEPGFQELRDPGLYPGFRLFIANWMLGYLVFASGRINALFSAFDLVRGANGKIACQVAPHAREVFFDSGGISALIACASGKGTVAQAADWLQGTPDVVDMAWRLHLAGAPPGVVAAMDVPAYAELLAPAGFTVASAEALTLANADAMRGMPLPPGWRPVYTTQGLTLAEHERCLAQYARLGVVADLQAGRAWLGVGGMAFEDVPERVWTVHRRLRALVGPQAHIHALGVSRLEVLVPMIAAGWVNSADSSSPAQEVRFNRGPYRVQGPRPVVLAYACHAAAALYAEATLAAAVAREQASPRLVQEELPL